MHIIKLDATDSTNAYLKNVMQSEVLDDFTTVIADEQSAAKGQLGSSWQSEAGKNLTISVLKKLNGLNATRQFILNMAVSLAVYELLKGLQISNLSIKWPNDILSGNQKICGILIENVLQGQKISAAVIGIGLNVNQQIFPGLKGATSIKRITGNSTAVEEILQLLLAGLKIRLSGLEAMNFDKIKADYEELLFRRDSPSTFRGAGNQMFTGYIRGISPIGKLRIEIEDREIREFDLKEIQLMY